MPADQAKRGDPYEWLWAIPIAEMTLPQMVLALSVLRSRRLCEAGLLWCPLAIFDDVRRPACEAA
jgi:hypothetical protein